MRMALLAVFSEFNARSCFYSRKNITDWEKRPVRWQQWPCRVNTQVNVACINRLPVLFGRMKHTRQQGDPGVVG